MASKICLEILLLYYNNNRHAKKKYKHVLVPLTVLPFDKLIIAVRAVRMPFLT